ncbi:hypothetical protein DFQ28_006461 [Apophysomyces sp. BC1034]|nr:hypothetical protein DFQ30_004312 [Apophysomyces sp. BC1015]KAG0182478.1 hypothetical protein DFQ29_003907 [Apophysomyces sp. BC1021]KAG0193086.1 hypothetical protein DFQ28_006461 [Apophysomyces sp. BC1034]
MSTYGTTEEPMVLKLTAAEQDLLQSDRPGYGSRSKIEVGFNLVNATCGAGIIGLPFAVYQAGFFPGIILSIIVAILSQLGLYMLIVAGQRVEIYKYAVLVEYLMGRPGYHFLNFMIFVQAAGSCVSYFILVGDTIPVLLELYFPQYPIHRSITVSAIAIIFVLPLNTARSIGSLARWSIVSVLCLPVILLTLLIRAPTYAPEHTAPIGWQTTDMFGAVGIMAFSFACSQVSFNNYLSLRDQSSRGWAIAISIAGVLSWSLSMLFAILGYLSFGTDVQSNLFLNFAPDDAIANIGRLTLGISMILTIPMAFYPTREAVQKSLGLETQTRQPTQVEHYILTVVLFLGITAIGISIRSLAKVYSVIGGFSASTLAYVLPAVAYLATKKPCESDETLKAPLISSPSSSQTSLTQRARPSVLLDIAAVILILWGTILMLYSISIVFTS